MCVLFGDTALNQWLMGPFFLFLWTWVHVDAYTSSINGVMLPRSLLMASVPLGASSLQRTAQRNRARHGSIMGSRRTMKCSRRPSPTRHTRPLIRLRRHRYRLRVPRRVRQTRQGHLPRSARGTPSLKWRPLVSRWASPAVGGGSRSDGRSRR